MAIVDISTCVIVYLCLCFVAPHRQHAHVRLQGLHRANSSQDDGSSVDHGDGYGIELMGARSRHDTPPSDAT